MHQSRRQIPDNTSSGRKPYPAVTLFFALLNRRLFYFFPVDI